MDEHRLIEQVLDCLEQMADRCRSAGELDPQLARDAVWFLRTYADRCHHGKEEAELFPLMEQRGLSPDSGPTAVMRAEHVEGRRLVGQIDEAIEGAAKGEEQAARSFAESSLEFVGLLQAHIHKEDHILFPAADRMLTEQDREALGQRFDRVDADEIGRDVIEKCRRTADALAERFGVGLHVPGKER
jgi:hemerythrin-like domain-containing protein